MKKTGQYIVIVALSTSLSLASAKSDLESNLSSNTTTPAQIQHLQLSKKNTEKIHSSNTPSDSKLTDEAATISTEQDKSDKKIAPDIDLKDVTEPSSVTTVKSQEDVDSSTENSKSKKGEKAEKTAELVPVEPLDFLGAKVLPNTSTRLAWSPGISLAGLALPTPVLIIHGAKTGPRLCLTAAIHGDELNGIEVVRRVMYDIEPEKLSGTIIGIPIVNLQGFQRGTRYLNDRRDLNRHFPGDASGSLAARVAHSLFNEVIGHCDMLVDIHTGSFKRNNLAQIRADMRNPKIVKFTEGFGDIVVVHSPGKTGMLRYAAIFENIKAVTMELGASMRLQKKQVDSGVKGIYSLLKKHKMYSKTFNWGQPAPIYYQSSWTRVTNGGILFSKVNLGDNVRKGTILGTVTDPITNESTDVKAGFSGKVIGIAENQVVMPGFAAYHIGVKSSEADLMDNAQSQEPVPKL